MCVSAPTYQMLMVYLYSREASDGLRNSGIRIRRIWAPFERVLVTSRFRSYAVHIHPLSATFLRQPRSTKGTNYPGLGQFASILQIVGPFCRHLFTFNLQRAS